MLDAETYPNAEVRKVIGEHFVPVRLDIDTQEEAADTYKVGVIPDTVLALPDGTVVHRFEGFLAPKEFVKELGVGVDARGRLGEILRRLQEKPEDPEARLDLGALYGGWKAWSKARAEFEAAADKTRDGAADLRARALYRLAGAQLHMGDDASAEKPLATLAAMDSPAAKAFVVESALERGIALLDRGEERMEEDAAAGGKLAEEARARIEGFLSDHPTHPRAAEGSFQIARSYRVGGDDAKAAAALKQLIGKYPDSPWTERAKKLLQGAPQ